MGDVAAQRGVISSGAWIPMSGWKGRELMASDESGENLASKAYASTVHDGHLVPLLPEEIGLVEVCGDPNMLVHELRSTSGSNGNVWAAVVTIDPCAFKYTFAGDETIHVLNGEATVEVDETQTVELRPGTIASFRKGTSSRWRIQKSFREFVVLTDA